MIGPDEELLYVGKSVRVRTRVLSYFRANKGEKAWELIRGTQRIEWEYIPNEFYSLVQEMKLIQLRQPRFNVQHKRTRIYAFVKVTSEAAARIVPVTRISEDGATYYGPFPRVKSVAARPGPRPARLPYLHARVLRRPTRDIHRRPNRTFLLLAQQNGETLERPPPRESAPPVVFALGLRSWQ